MRYVANPVIVDAWQISRVDPKLSHWGETTIELEGMVGSERVLSPEMTARMKPKVGDYLVRQADGYEYLNPKDVFERKYRPAPEQAQSAR